MINIDEKLWKVTQDQFSNIAEFPIVTIDKDGNEIIKSGEYPFFCELIKNKTNACNGCRVRQMHRTREVEIYECHAGLTNIIAPVDLGYEEQGAVIMTSIKGSDNDKFMQAALDARVEPEELKDELAKLELSGPRRIRSSKKILEAFAKTIPNLAKQSYASKKVITELNVLRKTSNILDSSLDLDIVIKNIIDFFLGTFKLINCSVTLFEERKKISDLETNEIIENNLIELIQQTNNIVDIRDGRNSILMDAKYDGAILALPLRVGNKTLGMISMYSEKPIEELGLFSTLSEQVSLGIMNAINHQHVSKSAITDKLTGLYNRGQFNSTIAKELSRSSRLDKPTSLIIMDIDNFKNLNDTCGHLKGDQVLRDVAETIRESIRAMDTPFRYGGEEFVALLPETDTKDAQMIAERIRESIDKKNFIATGNFDGHVTLSLGLVTCKTSTTGVDKLIKEADDCLYKAKGAGKNKVVSALILDENLSAVNLNDVNDLYNNKGG